MRKPVVVLHVGAMKTGTTYLQNKIIANRDALAEQGVDFAGTRWRAQVSGVQDLLSLAQHDPEVERRSNGAWKRLVRAIREADAHHSVLSMEFLSFADEDAAQLAIESLDGLETHVVITVRDTAAVVPALWQTTITSGGVMTWERFMTVVRASTRGSGRIGAALARAGVPSARRFSEAIDIPRMLRVWTAVVPPERVHVVVVPGKDAPRDRLWELFAEILGVDPAASPEPPEHINESLGLPSAELVRRLNVSLALGKPSQQRTVKVDLARDALSALRHDERSARLDPRTFRAALRWNGQIRSAIAETGVVVHGDLDDLPTAADPVAYGVDAAQVPPTVDEMLRAARTGFRAMKALNETRIPAAIRKKRRDPFREQLDESLTKPGRAGWRAADDPVEAAVDDLVTLIRSALTLERKAAKRMRRKAKRKQERRKAERKAARAAKRAAEQAAASGEGAHDG